MGAYKNLCTEAAEAGKCLIGKESFGYLEALEGERGIDWVGRTKYVFRGYDGTRHVEECISMNSAKRLVEEGLANDEIAFFVQCFGDFAPPDSATCDDCGGWIAHGIGRESIHGERFCEDCS